MILCFTEFVLDTKQMGRGLHFGPKAIFPPPFPVATCRFLTNIPPVLPLFFPILHLFYPLTSIYFFSFPFLPFLFTFSPFSLLPFIFLCPQMTMADIPRSPRVVVYFLIYNRHLLLILLSVLQSAPAKHDSKSRKAGSGHLKRDI